ncbi:hypothetical protein A1O3_04037 [Capronia epimyces CBS 606.96]|uniref:Uncharacterized protein n=1 Tax=Capronia epimyces CBS 606.96 TaxID=1182542 RepID=W9YXQ6_9EURO|nr:uncharacterized protein A1O3_04037 [Capronia epimyces CBS 606.96]EXJ87079.1 hypothetical protein A1O3_04037 [Capronia epimyces CBS 606.96]
MIGQTSLTTAFYDDPFERPPTPPDSPLRDRFCPKSVAFLRHIAPPPPGIEPAKDCRGRPLPLPLVEAEVTDRIPLKKKPQVPPKPPGLEFYVSNRSRQGSTVDLDSATQFTTNFSPGQHLAQHESCLRQQEFCLDFNMGDADQTVSTDLDRPCCHRHETLYKRELLNGVPVEILTHTCEISHSLGRSPAAQEVEH